MNKDFKDWVEDTIPFSDKEDDLYNYCLGAHYDGWKSGRKKVKSLKKENAKLREALSYYADKENWDGWADALSSVEDDWEQDGQEVPYAGKQARKALKEVYGE